MSLAQSALSGRQAHAPARPAFVGLPLYVLIDPFFSDFPEQHNDATPSSYAALGAQRSDAWERAVFLCQPDDPVIAPERLPYLVALNGDQDPWLDTVIASAQDDHQAVLDGAPLGKYRTGILIETSLDPALLIERIARMVLYRNFTSKPRYLHFADRRVFEALSYLLPPDALRTWLGPITRWHVLTRGTGWLSLAGAFDETQLDETALFSRKQHLGAHAFDDASLKVTRAQHERIAGLEAVSRALTEWERQAGVPDQNAHERAWAGVVEAAALGLKSETDKAAFAWRWMRDERCALRPAVIGALQRHRSEHRPFAELMDEAAPDLAHAEASAVPHQS